MYLTFLSIPKKKGWNNNLTALDEMFKRIRNICEDLIILLDNYIHSTILYINIIRPTQKIRERHGQLCSHKIRNP